MALDEALLLSASGGNRPATLRFFTWDTPSLTIGSFQKSEDLNLAAATARNIPIVRRPTGGRAVLHDAELTYSVICPIPSGHFPDDLHGTYKKIGECILDGLRQLGVNAELLPVDRDLERRRMASAAAAKNALCFSSPSWFEVLLGGKKLIGSAQRRLRTGFLQQGSLLLELDIAGTIEVQAFPDELTRDRAAEFLASKMTALSSAGRDIGIAELKAAIAAGFAKVLGTELVPGEPTPEEVALARKLLSEKYGREDWNLRRETSKETII
jgi:lipoate-protein ligase A